MNASPPARLLCFAPASAVLGVEGASPAIALGVGLSEILRGLSGILVHQGGLYRGGIPSNSINRSYHPEHTRSHQNSEVKQDWARLVLRSVTTWESLVTIVSFFALPYDAR